MLNIVFYPLGFVRSATFGVDAQPTDFELVVRVDTYVGIVSGNAYVLKGCSGFTSPTTV